MSSRNFLTIHTLTSLPWHNLNRDERGIPKQVTQGGGSRGVLSAQSLKRAARVRYEIAAADPSLRSRVFADDVVERAMCLADDRGVNLDKKSALKRAKRVLTALCTNVKSETEVPAPEPEPEPESAGVVAWLSADELDTLAMQLVESTDELAATDFISGATASSLAIAAFGRMFANAPNSNTEAGIAMSPAVTTHPITIEVDYFTTVDDLNSRGAAHLAQSFHTTGTYYRSITIDRAQLRRSWSGFNMPDTAQRLALMVRAIILSLPDGKKSSSAAAILPSFILTETQAHRTSYSFEKPVAMAADGGFTEPSAAELIRQATNARRFDSAQFGDTFLSGTDPALGGGFVQTLSLDELVDHIVAFILEERA